MSTKAIIVHPNADVHEWVTAIMADQQWDTQIPVPDVASVWQYLNDGTLSAQSEVLLFSDSLFSQDPEEFAVAIATFAPNALVVIITEDPDLEEPIRHAVSHQVSNLNLEKAPFYFFDAGSEDPATELEAVVTAYVPFVPTAQETPAETGSATAQETPAAAVKDPFAGYTQDEMQYLTNTLQKPGVVFSSTSSKGGSGKTTVALCLGITLAQSSKIAYEKGLAPAPLKIAIIDMDTRDGQIGFAINQTVPSVLNYFVEAEKDYDNLKNVMIEVPRYGVDMLLAPKRGRNGDYLSPQFYSDVIHKLRLMYDVVILDTSVNFLDPLLSETIYPESDAILFVTNLTKGAVFGMTRWMKEVTSPVEEHGAGIDPSKIGIVINQTMGEVGMDLDVLKRAAEGAPLLVAIPSDMPAVLRASNMGTLNELISKHEIIGPEYFKLASTVWSETELVSPVQEYLNSPEFARDQALQGKKAGAAGPAANYVPMGQAATSVEKPAKKKLFGGNRKG